MAGIYRLPALFGKKFHAALAMRCLDRVWIAFGIRFRIGF
jgi:hypothetical protein